MFQVFGKSPTAIIIFRDYDFGYADRIFTSEINETKKSVISVKNFN